MIAGAAEDIRIFIVTRLAQVGEGTPPVCCSLYSKRVIHPAGLSVGAAG